MMVMRTCRIRTIRFFLVCFVGPWWRSCSCLSLLAGQRIPSRIVAVETKKDKDTTTTPSSSSSSQLHSLLDLPKVESWATERGLKEHHLKTLYRVVMNANSESLNSDELQERLVQADFPKKHAAALCKNFTLCSSRIMDVQDSAISGGKKLLIELSSLSGKRVETVLIPHKRRLESENESAKTTTTTRYTVCVSSQVGCAKRCTFCATGTMGLQANLSSAEILEQVWLVRSLLSNKDNHHDSGSDDRRRRGTRSYKAVVRNVVFMGMGEPLDNYDAVHEACRGLTHQCLFGLSAKHVTISTVGDVPSAITRLADEAPQVSLALSLHGATQELRTQLVPTAKRAPLVELERALDYHYRKSGQGAMLEYLLIDGVNDRVEEDAQALVNFVLRRPQGTSKYFVNLIPYNPTIAGNMNGYRTPSDQRIRGFHNRLTANGIRSLIRWSSAAGRDANGACGQLVISKQEQHSW